MILFILYLIGFVFMFWTNFELLKIFKSDREMHFRVYPVCIILTLVWPVELIAGACLNTTRRK